MMEKVSSALPRHRPSLEASWGLGLFERCSHHSRGNQPGHQCHAQRGACCGWRMKALVDSYGFVASFSKYHEHHLSSLELLLRYKARDVCTAAHSFAEAYASLTGLPGAKRVTPDEAVLFLEVFTND